MNPLLNTTCNHRLSCEKNGKVQPEHSEKEKQAAQYFARSNQVSSIAPKSQEVTFKTSKLLEVELRGKLKENS